MNLKLTFAALLIVPMMLTACAKKEEAAQAGQDAASTAVADKVTPAFDKTTRHKTDKAGKFKKSKKIF